MYRRFWGRGGGSLAPTGARLGTALVPGWSRLFIKLDCVKGGPAMTPQNRSLRLVKSQIKRANNSVQLMASSEQGQDCKYVQSHPLQ